MNLPHLLRLVNIHEKIVFMTKKSQETSWSRGITEQVGENVRKFRKEKGWTVAQLSNETGKAGHEIPKNSLTNLELGRKDTVALQDVLILANCLHKTPDDLLSPPAEHEAKRLFETGIEVISEAWRELANSSSNFLDSKNNMEEYTGLSAVVDREVLELYEKIVNSNANLVDEKTLWDALVQATYEEDEKILGELLSLYNSESELEFKTVRNFEVVPVHPSESEEYVKSLLERYNTRKRESAESQK